MRLHKMCKHAETLHANKGYKLAIVFLYANLAVLKAEMYGTFFKRYLHKNEALHTPTFYMKINHFNIVFHMT